MSLDKKVFQREPVRQLPLDKLNASGQQIKPPVAQVVENDCLMPLFDKQTRDCAAYIPSAPGNQYLHKKGCPFMNSFFTLEVYYNRTWLDGRERSGHEFPERATRRTDVFCSSLFLPAV